MTLRVPHSRTRSGRVAHRVAHPVRVKKNLDEGAPSRLLLAGWGFPFVSQQAFVIKNPTRAKPARMGHPLPLEAEDTERRVQGHRLRIPFIHNLQPCPGASPVSRRVAHPVRVKWNLR